MDPSIPSELWWRHRVEPPASWACSKLKSEGAVAAGVRQVEGLVCGAATERYP